MMTAGLTVRKQTDRLTAVVRQDPKKAVVLAALVAVLGGLWGRMALRGGGGPATAVAAPAGAIGTVREAETPAAATSQYGELSSWLLAAPEPVSRNLFWLKLDYYPRDASMAAAASPPEPGDGLWTRVEKSMRDQTDQRKQRQIIAENLARQAGELNVQGIVVGTDPKALVNGTMVREGEVVAGFRVLRVEPRGIVVEREGFRLVVPMK